MGVVARGMFLCLLKEIERNMNPHTNYQQEMVEKIERLGGHYDPESTLSIEDPLLICETLIHSTLVDPTDEDGKLILRLREEENKRNGNVKWSVNDSSKRQENADETKRKKQAIEELKKCNADMSPKIIASHLEIIFSSYVSQEGHWLYVAQHYTPKSINSVINHMTKAHADGWITIKNSASYFTDAIRKYHKPRSDKRRHK